MRCGGRAVQGVMHHRDYHCNIDGPWLHKYHYIACVEAEVVVMQHVFVVMQYIVWLLVYVVRCNGRVVRCCLSPLAVHCYVPTYATYVLDP